MPYPDNMTSHIGGPYYDVTDNEEKVNADQVKIEAFCDKLRALADSAPALIDGLHYGSKMSRIADIQDELNGIAEEIEREDVSGILWEICDE